MFILRTTSRIFPRLTTTIRPLTSTPTTSPASATVTQTNDRISDDGLGTVRDVLKTKGEKFFYTRGDALVYDAVKKMVDHNIGSLIIVEGANKTPIGIVTETDYLSKVIVKGRSSKTTLVRDIMSTKEFTSVSPGATLHECMELMAQRRIRHIPVLETGGTVLGMVSVGDIVKELVAAHKKNAENMRSFIAGGY